MVAIKLSQFGGMRPAIDDNLLPEDAASEAVNTWMYDGKVSGLRVPRLIHTLSSTSKRMVFRVPKGSTSVKNIPDSYWIEFDTSSTTVVKGSANVTDQRFYWADGVNPPRYTTSTLVAAGSPTPSSYVLGVPAPASPPTIGTSGGASTINESRAYVFTHVSDFGEEGPPSPPSTITTYKSDGTWTLTIPVVGGDATDRTLTHTRIYRTITNDQGNADYYFVAEIAIATTSYADSALSDVIVLNETIPSSTFDPPPLLDGVTEMPNGMVIGWLDNQIWFCEPYQPHAWPASYQLNVDFKIKGIGVLGTSAVICTEGQPYICTGVHPASMTLAKVVGLNEPCVAGGSIVAAPEGVYYASQNGLVLVGAGSARLWSTSLVSKDKWQDLLNVARLNSALLGRAYVTFSGIGDGCFESTAFEMTAFEQTDFTGTRNGALIDLDDARIGFSLLVSDDPTYNVLRDAWTNELLLIRGDTVLWLDTTNNTAQGDYTWRSKIFQMPRPTNMGAVKIFWDTPMDVASPASTFRVYANGNLLFTKAVPASGTQFRLPSGNRYDFYQFEIEGNLLIKNLQIATTPKELRSL